MILFNFFATFIIFLCLDHDVCSFLLLTASNWYLYFQFENGGTSIDGPVLDYFHEQGTGYQYLSLRNQFGAGKYKCEC